MPRQVCWPRQGLDHSPARPGRQCPSDLHAELPGWAGTGVCPSHPVDPAFDSWSRARARARQVLSYLCSLRVPAQRPRLPVLDSDGLHIRPPCICAGCATGEVPVRPWLTAPASKLPSVHMASPLATRPCSHGQDCWKNPEKLAGTREKAQIPNRE